MKVLIAVFLTLALVAAVTDEDIIAEVNAKQSQWTAAPNQFTGMSIAEKRGYLGAFPLHNVGFPVEKPKFLSGLPTNFDSRTQWPKCVHGILNQGQCGSCWSFGMTEALSDRFCIASKGSINVVLSPEYVVDCDKTDYGCNGGYLTNAWNFAASTGTVSIDCDPYTAGSGQTSPCPNKCHDGSDLKFYKAKEVKSLAGIQGMQNAIYTDGPIETSFAVYEDFFSYSGGIYKHTSGGLAGYHAVKVLGWGNQSGTNFWIVANSWGTSWGEQGYFKIEMGQCGFEDGPVAGQAAV